MQYAQQVINITRPKPYVEKKGVGIENTLLLSIYENDSNKGRKGGAHREVIGKLINGILKEEKVVSEANFNKVRKFLYNVREDMFPNQVREHKIDTSGIRNVRIHKRNVKTDEVRTSWKFL